jgi:hypothetical protein
MDVVRIKDTQSVGEVMGVNASGTIMVRWAVTTSGQRLTNWVWLNEKPENLELIDRLEM